MESVLNQDYPHIEHIVVDGGSTDGTLDIIRSYPHVARLVSEQDEGLYDAINKGIRMASGEVVGILNSDDFFPDRSVMSKIAAAINRENVDAVFGDIAFVRPGNLERVVRLYSSKKFTPRKFAYGYMPAHPSFYARKSCFERFGYYQKDYQIAADYELVMRFIYRHKISYAYIPEILVYMRTGGMSNKSVMSRYILNREIVRACRENGVQTNMAILSLKYLDKIFEYIRPAIQTLSKG
jgi:glycosyltransferase involved in cell wall biosynthesis